MTLDDRIEILKHEMVEAYQSGDASRARVVYGQLREAVNSRPAEDVERMERERGLR